VQLETIVLKFLDAKTLKEALDKMVTPYGTVAVNEKTNSVVVCDTPESLRRILREIRKADQTPRQVMVEVVILDVQLKNDSEIGVNWDFLSTDLGDVGYRQSLTGPRVLAIPPTAETLGSAAAYNSVGLGGDFSVVIGSVRNVLHMIQEKRNVEILASPRVLVVSGQSATIKAVEEIPYEEVIDTAQGGQAALTSTRFKEVGVTLEVVATVADGNNILLDIQTHQSVRTGESPKGVPVVDSRQADTSLLLRDGQTAIIGGLRREEKTKQVNQVPILGDLPLIGALFRSVSTVTGHSELVVLLNPHIYIGDAVPDEVAARVDAIRSRSPLKTEVVAGPAPGQTPQTGVGQEP
jgi:protein transport protein HofQ